jgi:UTP-glucose-1-phosphate uridylyltransferase
MKPTLMILAAGMGSRYGGLKQLDGVGPDNELIIEYSIFDAIRAGFGKVVFVIRKDIEDAFRATFENKFEGKIDIAYAFQATDSPVEGLVDIPAREKPWGTAHAMLVARDKIDTPFAVINADDYYGVSSFVDMAQFLTNLCTPEHYSMIGYELANTLSDAGHVNRGVCEMGADGFLKDVVERHKIRRQGDKVYYEEDDGLQEVPIESLVSMNFFGFHPNIFEAIHTQFLDFVETTRDDPKAEFYIPLVVSRLIKANKMRMSVLPNKEKWYGVTYKEDKGMVMDAFKRLADEGTYPSPIWG